MDGEQRLKEDVTFYLLKTPYIHTRVELTFGLFPLRYPVPVVCCLWYAWSFLLN